MKDYLEELLDGFRSTDSDVVKRAIYNEMLMVVNSYCKNVRYGCYDMFMYVALYKCAVTPQQYEYALNQAYSIIDDAAFQENDDLISNIKEFVSLADCLREEDKVEFDIICMTELDFFQKELEWAKDQVKCGQADFGADVSIPNAVNELREVAELIVSTGMSDLESYREAIKHLKWWENLAVSVSHGFFVN